MDGDVVAQFSEFTGSTPDIAAQYLQLTEFNIEQAMQLYFENDGAPLARENNASTSTPSADPRRSGYEDESGVVHLDSDDDEDNGVRVPPREPPVDRSIFEDDAAMARRLQEEMYGAQDMTEEVRAPMARTTETLVGPEADFGEDMHDNILGQIRARQRRGSLFPRPPNRVSISPLTFSFLLQIDLESSINETQLQFGLARARRKLTVKGLRRQPGALPKLRTNPTCSLNCTALLSRSCLGYLGISPEKKAARMRSGCW
jgi:hypothetical protein